MTTDTFSRDAMGNTWVILKISLLQSNVNLELLLGRFHEAHNFRFETEAGV